MTEALMERETECVDGGCKVEIGKDLQIERSILLFDKAIDKTEGLELLGTANPTSREGIEYDTSKEDSVFVVRNHALVQGIEGAYVEVGIKEIISVITDMDDAMQFPNAIIGKRGDIVCLGVSRIVGYYSRVHNWNKSKVGELRNRAEGEYWNFENTKPNQSERKGVIDNL